MGSVVRDLIASVHAACVENRTGDILRGVPALEDVDPDSFGICLATADGYVYEVGDTRLPFCIQSISKPFTYGIALTDNGADLVDEKIDVEPSGELYNEISLHPVTHRPRNPMINAGALVAASLVAGATTEEQIERISRTYSMYAGRELPLDEDIFASQVESGHRNRAIGHMLREFGILKGNPDVAHEIYLRACSTMVTCHDLSMMGATLANGGANPLTGERVLAGDYTERVLSVMSTCGMYDAAGAWFAQVGLAAKSGVGGGIVAVLPGQLSIAAFSPRLDQHGNSVRAFESCRRLSRDLELHELRVARAARSAIRASYYVQESPSAVWRPEVDRRLLDEYGQKARIYEAHGDLLFGGAESVVREISEACRELDLVVLDVRRVGEIAEISRRLLDDLHRHVRAQECQVALIDPHDMVTRTGAGDDVLPKFATAADAIVWCEDWLIEHYGGRRPAEDRYRFRDHPLFAQASTRVADELERRMHPRSYTHGDLIVAESDTAAGAFLIMSGRVRCSITTTDSITRHLATLTPGTCFGEVYLVADGPNPLAMHADGSVELYELTRDEFTKISQESPELWAAIVAVFMSTFRDDFDRILRSLATGRTITR